MEIVPFLEVEVVDITREELEVVDITREELEVGDIAREEVEVIIKEAAEDMANQVVDLEVTAVVAEVDLEDVSNMEVEWMFI